MFIFKLVSLLRGYVIIRLKTNNCEKTLNLLRKNGIRMWDVEKRESDVKLKISYEDYEKYKHIIEKAKIETVSKKGLVFTLKKLKVRKGFAAGLFILLICLYVLSSLVWNVEVVEIGRASCRERV